MLSVIALVARVYLLLPFSPSYHLFSSFSYAFQVFRDPCKTCPEKPDGTASSFDMELRVSVLSRMYVPQSAVNSATAGSRLLFALFVQ